jgi:hypothetical protein
VSTKRHHATRDAGPSCGPAYEEKSIRWSKIRTRPTTGLRKHSKNWTNGDHHSQHVGQTFLSARLDLQFTRRAASANFRQTRVSAPRAHKKRRPFASGHGLRGGRWPGPQVERDGSRCYCGRGWVSERSNNSVAAAISLGGIAAAGFVSHPLIRGPIAAGSFGSKKVFFMPSRSLLPGGTSAHPRRLNPHDLTDPARLAGPTRSRP